MVSIQKENTHIGYNYSTFYFQYEAGVKNAAQLFNDSEKGYAGKRLSLHGLKKRFHIIRGCGKLTHPPCNQQAKAKSWNQFV